MSADNKASTSGASMARNSSRKPVSGHDDPQQSERFLEAAREHEAATTEEEATRAFRKVVGVTKKRKR
jgi:hypothetical protein